MGSMDSRFNSGSKPIAKGQFAQLSWPTGGGHAAQTASISANMLIERIDVIISSVAANPTVDVTITDGNSCVVATLTALADGTKHVKLATKSTPDFPAIPVAGTLTVSVDPSAAPDGSGETLTVDVIIYGP